jgi:hypothetical protein
MKTEILASVTFGRGGNSEQYQAYGWHGAENGFNWTLGTANALILPRIDCPNGCTVEAHMVPRVRETGPTNQRVTFLVNGYELDTSFLNGPATLGFIVPTVPAQDRQTVITIKHPDAFNDNATEPRLGIAFVCVRITRISRPTSWNTPHIAAPIELDFSGESIPHLLHQTETLTGISGIDLLNTFEMLVGNCEFGGIQRRFGAEPLSLLRFAGASAEASIKGLDTDFDGIGEDLDAEISSDAVKEWIISDKKFNLRYHTFISAHDISREDILVREQKKVAFLKRKFLEDLVENRKIFICVDRFKQPLSAALPPFFALNRHGTHPLLWVTEGSVSEIGTVEEILPNLFVAKVDRLSKHGQPREAALDLWLSILIRTWLMINGPYRSI